MARGFTVKGVEIEGFKGFASPKAIDFKGRHVFLLGPNGNGKSSIVEAIRWGLFGSAHRRNEVVKNQHYSGDCRVTVNLERDGQLWTLRRMLNLGAGGSSEPVLTDQHGNKRPIREIMPQLDSVDAGEGTHVIFAGQSAPLRRQPEDLSPFEKTVLNYVGLTHPRALLSNINDFLEDQTNAEHELDEEIAEVQNSLDRQIKDEETRRGHILNAPPWGDGHPPSIADSEQRVRSLIEEVTGNSLGQELEGLSLDALVDSVRQLLDERRTQGQGSLEKEVEELAEHRGSLERLRDVQVQVGVQESTARGTQLKLEAVYDGLTPEDLKRKLANAKYEATTESIKSRIARDAIDLIRRDSAEEILCPICSSHHDRQILEDSLQGTMDNSIDAMTSVVASLESRIQDSESLEELLKEQEARLKSLNDEVTAVMNLLHDEDKSKLTETNDIGLLIEDYSGKESEIEARIEDEEKWFDSKAARLNKLKEEARFHRIQRRLNSLQTDKRGLLRVIDSYDHLVAFGESVRAIKRVVASQLSEQLARDIPRVSELLSRAFGALTQHPWYDRLVVAEYDRLVVEESTLPRLQLRVGSSQDSNGREDPIGVLNGQAESALHLVPYFAFSQADDAPTEVYLVMLDDPTRALDIEHIRILVERLQELSRNVQLIVASQETERLLKIIPDVFDKNSLAIIEPTGWSPSNGPNLKIRYE